MNVLWCEMYMSTPEEKAKYLVKMLAEAVKRESLSSEVSPVLTWTRRSLSQEEDITPKATARLQFVNAHRDKDLHFGNMSCGLMKLKSICVATMIIVTFEGKRGKLANLRTASQLLSIGVAASCCGSVLLYFHKIDIDGIMRKEHDAEILKQHLKTSAR